MERGDFEHRAVVEQIMSHAVRVSIVQETACATCVAAQLCNSSEKKQKTMDIVCDTHLLAIPDCQTCAQGKDCKDRYDSLRL